MGDLERPKGWGRHRASYDRKGLWYVSGLENGAVPKGGLALPCINGLNIGVQNEVIKVM